MIQLHILTIEQQQLDEIMELLTNENLIIDASITNTVSKRKYPDGKTKTVPIYLLLGISKAILFSKIEKLLKEKYKKNMPTIYSTPIINMCSNNLNQLRTATVYKD